MKLWQVSTGKCLYTWEFPTAVKSVAFNDDGTQVVCITEQRMGYQSAIRVFDINRDDPTKRMPIPNPEACLCLLDIVLQNLKNLGITSIPSVQKLLSVLSPSLTMSSSLAMNQGRLPSSTPSQEMRSTATSVLTET
jgi:hypothetical protein